MGHSGETVRSGCWRDARVSVPPISIPRAHMPTSPPAPFRWKTLYCTAEARTGKTAGIPEHGNPNKDG